ncbi:hypothetical protein [Nostoc sp.]|uniref:hypothetical protein n=1 Tax=Nostoc sp. TaxID=1180 RepID=UPI002D789778|nr:hypothetical protein [Nostoc sp.]
MTFLNKINWNFLRKNSQNSSGIDPSAPIQQSTTPLTPKNLAKLEHEMERREAGSQKILSASA